MKRAVLLIPLLWTSAAFPAPSLSEDQSEIRASEGCGAQPLAKPGRTATLFMKVGELEREARVHLPRGYDENSATSLILDIHGYTGTAESEELETTRFSRHADEHGYIIVYPQGTGFVAEDGAHDFGNEIIWEFFSRHSRAKYLTASEAE